MQICTIIAKNYVAFARTLTDSFLSQHPDGTAWVLVIDDFDGYIDPSAERFLTVTPGEVGIEEFDRMAALYDVLELSTAVKPWFLRHLLHERRAEQIVYLDPDIRLFAPLEQVGELVRRHRLVLTPHLTQPMPRDGKRPSETDILIAGAYNLGFLGLARGADTDFLLDWWAERLRTDCVVAPERGYFVDQRWMDFAPGLVREHAILSDAGHNVAYWNLSGRRLDRDGDAVTVNGEPLVFFHYSGFDPTRPDLLSKHQNRIRLSDDRVLANLCELYRGELLAHGAEQARDWPYSYAELPGGLRLDSSIRAAFRDAETEGVLSAPAFTDKGARQFVSWLNEPTEPGAAAGVTRYLHGLRERRADLRAAFPTLAGHEAERFMAWAHVYGRSELPAALVPGGGGGASDGPPSEGGLGVNLAGYFDSVLGVGEVARQLSRALESQGVAVAPVSLTATLSRQDAALAPSATSSDSHAVNLICVNADVLPAFAADAGHDFFDGRHSIGVWWWEVSTFPDRWRGAFSHLDELWVGSRFIADTMSQISPIPVVHVDLPVASPRIEPIERSRLGLPEDFLFLFVFDYHSVFARKNPLGLVDAFGRAFAPGSGASLVIKSINAEHHPAEHEALCAAAASHPDVHLIDRYVSSSEKDAMVAACDCYVSLHRSEGFGITLAEAMQLGKPVVATGYSGNLDFMSPDNSYLVEHRLVAIGEGSDPYPPEGVWAEPDLDDAALKLRAVYDDPETAATRARRGEQDIRMRHSPAVTGRKMADRLRRIADHGAGSASHSRAIVGIDTDHVAKRIAAGPYPLIPGRLDRLRHAARELVLKAIRPYTYHQRQVDEGLLHALRQLNDGVSSLAELVPDIRRLVSESRAIPYMSSAAYTVSEHPVAGRVTAFRRDEGEGDVAAEERYRHFEELFRGPEEFIRERQRAYLDLLEGREPVFDAGCGRGEMLDLLGDQGITYLGVDADPGMVALCQRKGHAAVELGDANAVLERQADGSLGAVFSAQFVEHLPPAELLRFLDLSALKLRRGGVLIAETVNPHSAQALKTFWVDLSHQHPIFPEVALSLADAAGFESAFVFHPNGTRDVEVDRYHQGEYALVATRGLAR